METLTQFLNSSTHPAISKFTYRLISTGKIGGFDSPSTINETATAFSTSPTIIVLANPTSTVKVGARVSSTVAGMVQLNTKVISIVGTTLTLDKPLLLLPSGTTTQPFTFNQFEDITISSGTRLNGTGSFTEILQSQTNGIGKNASFFIGGRVNDPTKYLVNLVKPGKRYKSGELIKIDGASLDGFSQVNDLTIQVNSTVKKIYAAAKVSSDDNNFRVKLIK
jgi:hypothetical protein